MLLPCSQLSLAPRVLLKLRDQHLSSINDVHLGRPPIQHFQRAPNVMVLLACRPHFKEQGFPLSWTDLGSRLNAGSAWSPPHVSWFRSPASCIPGCQMPLRALLSSVKPIAVWTTSCCKHLSACQPGLLRGPMLHDPIVGHRAWQRMSVTGARQTALHCVPCSVTAAVHHVTIRSLTFRISQVGTTTGSPHRPLTRWGLRNEVVLHSPRWHLMNIC